MPVTHDKENLYITMVFRGYEITLIRERERFEPDKFALNIIVDTDGDGLTARCIAENVGRDGWNEIRQRLRSVLRAPVEEQMRELLYAMHDRSWHPTAWSPH